MSRWPRDEHGHELLTHELTDDELRQYIAICGDGPTQLTPDQIRAIFTPEGERP